MNAPEPVATAGPAEVSRVPARWFVQWNLAMLGAGFAWFAYIDAPITDGAMRVFAVAVVAGLLSVIAALVSGEAPTAAFIRRSRRAALLLFIVATALMLTAATATLNLRGAGMDDSDTQTTVVMPT